VYLSEQTLIKSADITSTRQTIYKFYKTMNGISWNTLASKNAKQKFIKCT
jgi:hypothetical protein